MEAGVIQTKISRLQSKHRQLDQKIEDHEQRSLTNNPIELQRLKKLKLSLKDQITQLQSSLVPDISA